MASHPHSSVVRLIELHADEISQEVTEGYFAKHPGCAQGDVEKIRRMCKTDLLHHLRFLCCAISVESVQMFVDYVHWLRDVLVSRNMSLEHPRDSFTLLKHCLGRRLPSEAVSGVLVLLDAGIHALDDNEPAATPVRPPISLSGTDVYVEALIRGDRKQAESIALEGEHRRISLVDVGVGLVQPAMYEIGRLWQNNQVSVAQEHMATAISTNILAKAFTNAEFEEPVDRKAVFACVEGNHHSLGLRMVSDAYEVQGWDCLFLGADTPELSIIDMVAKERPDVLGLSLSMPHQLAALQNLLARLQSDFGGNRPRVVAGGLALNAHAYLAAKLPIDAYFSDARKAIESAQ